MLCSKRLILVRPFDSCDIALDFVLRLFELLRENGIKIGALQSQACAQAMVLAQAALPEQVRRICRIALINRKQDLPAFERIYDWLLAVYLAPASDHASGASQAFELTVTTRVQLGFDTPGSGDEEAADRAGYSTRELDRQEDFRFLPQQDYPAVLALLERIARDHAAVARRRRKRAKRVGQVDMRATLRESWKYDGEIMRWHFKRRIPTHTRLTVAVDVSGSMEIYGVFLLNFLHALQRNRNLKIDVFVFSTALCELTPQFRHKNFRAMLENVTRAFSGWSGGTRIGAALHSLNELYPTAVTPKTLVTIMSDGWDTGDIDLLEQAMATLSRRAKAVVWINPLKGDAGYEPVAKGIATALPYCDAFISGHSIESLQDFAQFLDR